MMICKGDKAMSKVLDFLRECGAFFVLTKNENFPAGRPFGAVTEIDSDLYISTSYTKAVYRQLKAHHEIQIAALKPGTREWIRISGIATEIYDIPRKQKMLDDCQNLHKYHTDPHDKDFNVFKVEILNVEFK